MLRVTVDIFSGRPNPTWIVTSDEKIERLRRALVENPAAISAAGEGYQGLGYRGVQLHFLDDDNEFKLPPQFMIANDATEASRSLRDVARGLLEAMTRHSKIPFPDHVLTPVDKRIRNTFYPALISFTGRRSNISMCGSFHPGAFASRSTTATVTIACTKKAGSIQAFGTTTLSSRQTTIATTTPATGAPTLSRNRAAPPATGQIRWRAATSAPGQCRMA